MSKKEKTFYPTGIHGIRRGDIYYVDFGKIEDVVGREAAKKRPVLIVQNNLGNKVSDTVICLCLTSRCKGNTPYHVYYRDTNILKVPSDICAEQIQTIDKCRLLEYCGNVGERVMQAVDHALAHSLGMKHANDGSLELEEAETPEVIQEEPISAYRFLQEQVIFWNNITIKLAAMKNDVSQLEEEIESILNFIEDTTYNAAQGYRVYKLLRDKRAERKKMLKKVICMEALLEQINSKEMVGAFQTSLDHAGERINAVNKVTVIKELQSEMQGVAQNSELPEMNEIEERIEEQQQDQKVS